MSSLEKYPKYKESGVEWIDEIPESWEVLSNKHIFKLKKNLVGKKSSEYELLSLTLGGIIKRDMENPEGKFPAEFDTYQEVKKDDFVFCLFDVEETPRTVGLSKYDGMITGAYTVMTNTIMNDSFLYYFYLNLDTKKRMKFLYKGLRNTIPKDSFFAFKTLVPPKDEQTKIADYLDKKTVQIDKAITLKDQLIEKLKERRQVLINDAVTKGLDPNVKMKDSGVEWIGEIPEHWEVLFNRRLFREKNRKITKRENLPLSLSQIDGVIPSKSMKERSLSPSHRDNFKLCKINDLVVNRFKGHLGVFFKSEYSGIITFHYGIFTPEKNVNTKYFELLYHTEAYKTIYAGASNGMTIGLQNLSNQNFYDVKSLVPPKTEQDNIVKYSNNITLETNNSIDLIQREIYTLQEYKSTLIDSVVTGKVKIS